MSRLTTLSLIALAASLVTGCGGGASAPPARPVAGSPSSGNLPTSFGKSTASAKIVIHPRSSKHAARSSRKRQYVASATQGAIATFVDTANGNASTSQGYALQPNATATLASPATCGGASEDGSYTCTVFFNLSPTGGPYTTTITTYDAAQSGTTGVPVAAASASSAVALSTDTESVTVTANQDNSYDFDLQGIVEAIAPTPQYIGVAGSATPSPLPVLSSTFVAFDGDGGEIDSLDTTSNFAAGKQPSGPFSENVSFPVSVADANTCGTPPCLTTTSTAVTNPASEQTAFSYNGTGSGGDGVSTPPYYGVVTVSAPNGFNASVSAYVVPFFGFVDSTSTFASGSSAVSFVSPSNSITVYAAQYHLPDGASGYAADTSACGSGSSAIATSSAATNNPGYGASFTLSAGSASGTCNVVLSDGAGDSATIAVTSTAGGNSTITVPCSAPTSAPNSRTRHAAAAAPCPQHTANLYSSNGGVQCATDSSTVASFGYPARGSVTTTDLANGTVQAKFTFTGGNPNSAYTADITCVGAIGTFTTDANGNATATFTLPSNFTAGSMAGFDAGDADSNDGITGVFAI